MSTRLAAISRWWTGLDDLQRAQAAAVADTGGPLPVGMFCSLVDAHVLAVTRALFESVRDGGSQFPLPGDIAGWLHTHPAT